MQEMAFELSGQQHEALNGAKAAYDAFLQKQNKHNANTLLSKLQEAESTLPSGLTDSLGTLPTTDNIVIVYNLFPPSTPDTDKLAIRFPELFLSQYSSKNEDSWRWSASRDDIVDSFNGIPAQHLHHDNYRPVQESSSFEYRYLMVLTGVKLGGNPCATRILSLGTALQNPMFNEILTSSFYQDISTEKNFEQVLVQVGSKSYTEFYYSINGNIKDLDKNLLKSGLYLLTPGKGIFLNNATLLHGKASLEVTSLRFPDLPEGNARRTLCRHIFPFAESAHPLLQARQAAQNLISR